MISISVLYIGANPEIKEVVYRLLNNREGIVGTVASNLEEVQTLCLNNFFNLVLLGSGINTEMEQELRNFFKIQFPNTKITQHYGGGSGLLFNEIQELLEEK